MNRKTRSGIFSGLDHTVYDLAIIGGGITGAGIALDAASRGLKVILLEQKDFASGTSSRSTRLIHGGLRYLSNFEFGLVRETGRERRVLHRLAWPLVWPEKMLLPFYKGNQLTKFKVRLGLWLYDFLAGVSRSEKKIILSSGVTLTTEPLLKKENISGAGLYTEYHTHDARLVISILKTAHHLGCHALNYFKAESHRKTSDHIWEIPSTDKVTQKSHTVRAKQLVNASGIWVNEIETDPHAPQVIFSKGSHIFFKREKLPLNQSVYFEGPDGRLIFAIPDFTTTYVGTTDNFYTGSKDHPTVTDEEIRYLLNAINYIFPSAKVTDKDVSGSWSGIRPLVVQKGKSSKDISRKDEIFLSSEGLITIAGGKLTGYRKMAERVVDIVIKQSGLKFKNSKTDSLHLDGLGLQTCVEISNLKTKWTAKIPQLKPEIIAWVIQNWGLNAEKIFEGFVLTENQNPLSALLHAITLYCRDNEAALFPEDILERRTSWYQYFPETMETALQNTVEWIS